MQNDTYEAAHGQNMSTEEVTQARHVGLWRILAASLALTVIGFIAISLFTAAA
jgi:hypothetical protein